MVRKSFRAGAEGSLIVAVVDAVDECCGGVPDDWLLCHHIDIEAVETIVASTPNVEIQFSVAVCQVTVTGTGEVRAKR